MTDLGKLVIEQVIANNFNMVTLAWSSGMAWWLSASAFCLTLITKLYPKKEELKSQDYYLPIGMFVSIFLASMIAFGVAVILELSDIESSLYDTFITSCAIVEFPSVEHIFTLVRKMYILSTSTMVVFLISWIYVWFSEKPFKLDRP